MLHGQRLYIDEWDTKLPSIYLINELWQKCFGDRYQLHSIAETIVSAFTAVPLFALILRKTGVRKWALATLCFAATYALIPGEMNTTENYAAPLLLGAVFAAFSNRNLVAGFCAALAVTFWIPSCLILIPVIAYEADANERRAVFISFAVTLVAYAISIAGIMAVNLPELFGGWTRYVFRDNAISGSTSSGSPLGVLHFLYSGVVISGAGIWLSALAVVLRRPRGRLEWFAILWVGSALLGAAASGRFYADYFVPLIAPLIFSSFVLASSAKIAPVRWVFVAVALILCWRTGVASVEDYRSGTQEAKEIAALAHAINSVAGTGAVVSVDAYVPAVYLAANAYPVNRLGVVHLSNYVKIDKLGSRDPVLILASSESTSPSLPAGFAQLCRRQFGSEWHLKLYAAPGMQAPPGVCDEEKAGLALDAK